MRPDPAEVSACVWVDAGLVRAIVSAVDGEEKSFRVPADLPQSVRYLDILYLIRSVLCKKNINITVPCSMQICSSTNNIL